MINDEAVGYAVGALYNVLEGTHEEKQKKCNQLAAEMYYLFDIKTKSESNTIRRNVLTGTKKEIKERL